MRWAITLLFAVAGMPSEDLNTALSECDDAVIDLGRMKSPDGVISHNIKITFSNRNTLYFAFCFYVKYLLECLIKFDLTITRLVLHLVLHHEEN